MGKLVFFDQISLISKIGIANAKICSGKDTKYGYIMRDLGWVAHFFLLKFTDRIQPSQPSCLV